MLNFLKSKRVLLIAAIATLLGWAGLNIAEKDIASLVNLALQDGEKIEQPLVSDNEEHSKTTLSETFNNASHISDERREHILYGDATGGGHKFGIGAPCKSEFPKHWDDATIIKEIELIASNDNLNWEQQRNGYYVTEQDVGTVRVRVVKGRDGEEIITGYPVNLPRNPCPATKTPANDNTPE